MATSATNLVGTLGAGSGIDIKSLAQQLVDVEKQPRADAINKKISKSEARISGLSAIKFCITDLQSSLAKLKSASTFGASKVLSSLPSMVGAVSGPSAQAGSYNVEVTQLAQSQRTVGSFASATQGLSKPAGAAAVTLNFSTGSNVPITVRLDSSAETPQGIVNAVNASFDLRAAGISAQLVTTGADGAGAQVVFSGGTGTASAFTVSSNSTDVNNAFDAVNVSGSLAFGAVIRTQESSVAGQVAAANAKIKVNGISIERLTNTIGDAITGVTLDLNSVTSSGSPVRVTVTRDIASIKENVHTLVKAYNDLDETLNILSDPKSTVEKFGGALAGDSLVRSIRSSVSSALISASSTPSTNVKALRDIGVSIDRNGKMQLDESRLDTALSTRYGEVMTMLTGNSDNVSAFSSDAGGVAGDAFKTFDALIRTTGILTTQSVSTTARIDQLKKDLSKLDDQMQTILDRYIRQFSVMDSLVSNSNATRTSLKNTFDGMNASRN